MRAMSCASSLNVFGTSRSRPNACSTRLRASLNRSASSRYLARSAGNPRSMPSALPLQSAIWLERSLIRPLRPSIALPSSSSRLPSLRAFQSVLTPSERLGVAASISSTSCRRHSFRLSSSLISRSASRRICAASLWVRPVSFSPRSKPHGLLTFSKNRSCQPRSASLPSK